MRPPPAERSVHDVEPFPPPATPPNGVAQPGEAGRALCRFERGGGEPDASAATSGHYGGIAIPAAVMEVGRTGLSCACSDPATGEGKGPIQNKGSERLLRDL